MSNLSLGKQTRMNRIFSHPSKRIMAIAVDHLINYPVGMPEGLKTMKNTVRQIVAGRPNSITMLKGTAKYIMSEFAGQVPFVLQQMATRPDIAEDAETVSVEEAVSLGADAIAVAVLVNGQHHMKHIGRLASVVRESERYGLPVITHIYPIDPAKNVIKHDPESIFFTVRVAMEMGVDIIKTPYTGDVASFRDIVAETPVPVVCAGGPKCNTLDEVIAMVRDITKTGAAGVTFGRNIWGFPNVVETMEKVKKALFE